MKVLQVLLVGFLIFTVNVEGGGSANDCNFCAWESCDPTVKGIEDSRFDPEKDARDIGSAIGVVFVDKDEIVNILSGRTERQKQEIASKYNTIYPGHKLKEDVIDIVYGDMSTAFKILIEPLSKFYAKDLNRALTDINLPRIVEILTILPPCAIQQVHQQYSNIYRMQLKDAITESLKEKYPLKTVIEVILLLAEGDRPEPSYQKGSKDWNKRIEQDVKDLENVFTQDVWDKKNKKFRELFGTRTLPQLRDIAENYDKRKGSLKRDIEKARFENAEVIYLTILEIVKGQPEYFAAKIHHLLESTSMMWRVDRNELNYFVFGRCSIDLGDIKKAFLNKYKSTLYLTILKKITRTQNDYYKTILTIIKDN